MSLVEEAITADEAIALIGKAKTIVEADMGVKVISCNEMLVSILVTCGRFRSAPSLLELPSSRTRLPWRESRCAWDFSFFTSRS